MHAVKEKILRFLAAATLLSSFGCGDAPPPKEPLPEWPPRLNQPYPDITLTDISGKPVHVSDFKGKIIIIEPIGMNCPACNAFAGANRPGGPGGFEGTQPQQGVRAFEEYVSQFGQGLSLNHSDIVLLQVLFFDPALKAPTLEQAQAWDRHFGVSGNANRKVLFADERFLDEAHYQATYNLIPGFQLIDRNFVLKIDAAGHHPPHNIHTNLVPMMQHLIYGY